MIRTAHPTFRGWLKKHWLPLTLIPLLIAACAWGNYAHAQRIEAEIAETRSASQTELAELDTQIAAIEERKAEEARQKKLAEAKAAADAVIATPDTAAQTVNPTSCNVSGTHNDPTRIDVVVNKKHCIQPLTYAPADLVTVHGATLSAKASQDFSRLYAAAQAAGQPFTVTSSYRSYYTQVDTYNYWVGVSGAAGADTYSARPGYSEHQTGFVVDIASPDGCALDCFGSTSQYQWMKANAATYGFIQRYYDGDDDITGYTGEEWHYRYVGVDVATDMRDKGIRTLEQYWGIPGGYY